MDFVIDRVFLDEERELVKQFLATMQLRYEKDIDHTLMIRDGSKIIATISSSKNVIKCFAIDPYYQGYNLADSLISQIVLDLANRGYYDYRVFTKTANTAIFKSFNMNVVAQSQKVTLLENKVYSIKSKLKNIAYDYDTSSDNIGAIVMNCNPMTQGHLYLVETAAKKCSKVFIFVVQEDRSLFRFKDRISIVKEATKHLDNVEVLPSTDYLISSSTFPTYFLKESDDFLQEYANIDVDIFKNYFMPAFNIKKRFVGTEPTDVVTNTYNQVIKAKLQDQVEIIERKKNGDITISASYVRKILKETGDVEQVKDFVTNATYEFLKSDEGLETIERIKNS